MAEFSNEQLILLVSQLREELEREKLSRTKLEEECDLLSIENERLNKVIIASNGNLSSQSQQQPTPSQMLNSVSDSESDILRNGDGMYANIILSRIENVCSGLNATCTAFCEIDTDTTIAIVGGTDKFVRAYNLETKNEIFGLSFSAPVLAINTFKNFIACSMMDGSHSIINSNNPVPESVTHFKDHTKYITNIIWSADGEYLATASNDQSVRLYKRRESSFECSHVMMFTTTPESIIFAPNSTSTSTSISPWQLIIGLRSSPYLLYVDCCTFEEIRVSMNERDWDTHPSFTPLFLSLSPNSKHLLVATDKHMHIIFKLGTSKRLRILASHSSGDYGRPRVAWDFTGHYVYSNSETDFDIHVYSVSQERVVEVIKGHKGAVRDIKAGLEDFLFVLAIYS
eukprot:gene4261-8482_t